MNGENAAPDLLSIMSVLGDIPLTSQHKTEALTQIAELARQALGSHLCTVALVDLVDAESGYLTIVACAGCDQALEHVMAGCRFKLGSRSSGASLDYELIAGGGIIEREGLQTDGQGIIDPAIAVKFGIDSASCYPLVVGKRLLGYLNHFAAQPLSETEHALLEVFARHAVLTIESFENQARRSQLEQLNAAMQLMSEVHDEKTLLNLTLDAALAIVGASRGWISRLDLDTGMLHIAQHSDNPIDLRPLEWGKGVTGKALVEERPIRVDDVHSPVWRDVYEEFWPDTCSELAVPIVEHNAEVRVRHQVERGTKPIGVLNIESPKPAAFSKADEDLLWLLAKQAAVMSERIETDRKLADLARVQREIVTKRDWEEVMQVLMGAVTGTLGYHFVNVSLVVPELNLIRTEYLRGVPEGSEWEFKRMAKHALNSNDIQAHIYRSHQIEVPDSQDERFDPDIYLRFGHDNLIRVYVPMIVAADQRCMGTVEAGYRREYRRYIYERDVQILQGFVDYAVQALEQRQRGLLDKISHELRAPIAGIRSNASFLERRRHEIDEKVVTRKLEDVMVDCDLLLFQVKELEHLLGRKPPWRKISRTLVFRDVIIKTLRQLKPLVMEDGFDTSRVAYDKADMHKIDPLWVDMAEINQVVYNLLINAIKYAEKDKSQFRVKILVEVTPDAYVVKFQDWGIGVQTDWATKIFDDGVRTPEAIARHPTGSGLGLTIARQIMRSYSGDLLLTNRRKPTEFAMRLPKQLKEEPHDTIRRR